MEKEIKSLITNLLLILFAYIATIVFNLQLFSSGILSHVLYGLALIFLGGLTFYCLFSIKQGKFKIEDTYTLEDIENNNYKLIPIEEALSEIETINITEEVYNKILNGAIIDKIFTSDYANLMYDNKIVALYKTYDKDETKAKPFKMFIN